MAAPILLTLAGMKRTTGAPGAWDGGAVVQLQGSTWVELAAGSVVAWNLQNFQCAGVHVLFYILSAGMGLLSTPDRGQLYRSIDQGAAWTDVTPSSGGTEYAVDMAKDADDNFWLITSEQERQDATSNNEPCRIYKSTDYGETWALSYEIPEVSFTVRNWQGVSITCHPTDADIVLVEGVEMTGLSARLWRTVDGGATWSAAFAPSWPTPPGTVYNHGGSKQHIFDYTLGGDIVYAGIMVSTNDYLFVLKSLDDGDTFTTYHTEADSVGYGAVFQEAALVYLLYHNNLFQSEPPVGQGQVTKIADEDDSPFTTDHDFHGLSRHVAGAVDTLHVGCNVQTPGGLATDDPSVFTRPADLGSGWVEHAHWGNMESDLGYRLYVGINGLVGATKLEPETVRPRPPDEPPGGGGPIGPPGEPTGEPGVGRPGTGLARRPRMDMPRIRRRRGRADAAQLHKRQPLVIADRIDKSQIPQTAAEPTARRWMPFGWLIGAVVEGHKTMTLRDWDPVEGVQWNQGELFYAYDLTPMTGGRRMALLRVAAQPYQELTSKLGKADFLKLGYGWAQATRAAPPSGRAVEEMWADMQSRPQRLWVVRFTLERLYDQRAPERGTVKVGE